MKLHLNIVLVAFVAICLSFGSAYKFLGVLHTAARSHHIVGSSLMKGLVAKGHEVTVISPFPSKKPMENYTDIDIPGIFKAMEKDMNSLLSTLNKSVIENVIHFHDMGIQITRTVLEDPSVQKLMKSNAKFDAVICEVFLSEALYGLAEHFQAPLIGLGTFGAITWNTDMIGSPSPASYVPHALLRFTDHMSLVERIGNLAFLTFDRIFLDYFYLPRQEALYKEFFPNNKRSLEQVRKSTSAILLNTHVSISSPRPYMPNQIEVGGMHINRNRKPLPAELEKFINEAKHGVIYFSMGSNLKSKDLPLDRRQTIMNTFRSINQRVIWKFEDPMLEGKPDNVFISSWLPQDDILAHKNVKAFITHGGLLSTTESIYHGTPFIGIPIFGDQFLNMARAEANGYGIKLDYNNLSVKSFRAAIDEIIRNPKYSRLVRQMSERFRDQSEEPLERAIYWVEHVARHEGAHYLHCAGLDLSFIQYHNIDAILILYGGIIFVFSIMVYMLRLLLGLLFKRKPAASKAKKN